eukprot:Rmarinus@m.7583
MSETTNQPTLCANNCGFYGNPMNENLCSKCYADRKKAQEPPSAEPSNEKTYCTNGCPFWASQDQGGLCSKCWKQSTTDGMQVDNEIPPLPSPPAPKEQPVAVPVAPDSPEQSSAKVQKNKSRCFECRKKIGLTGFQCKCGFFYCSHHRYKEDHDCSFDWKADGRDKLAKTTTKCVADKVQKI